MQNNYNEKIHESLLYNWLIKAYFEGVNDSILVFKEFIPCSELSRIFEQNDYKNILCITSKEFKGIKTYEDKNIVLVVEEDLDYSVFDNSKKGFLFMPFELKQNLMNTINNKNKKEIYEEIVIDHFQKYLYFVERNDPYKFLINNKSEEIFNYINFSINSYFKDSSINIILNQTTYILDTFFLRVKEDIDFFKKSNFLPSRLAVVVYRLNQLDFYGTTTKTGRYFSNILAKKSKTINEKKAKELGVLSKDLIFKNFKAYDFNEDIHKSVRIEIAQKLKLLTLDSLDDKTIAEITGLSTVDINKI